MPPEKKRAGTPDGATGSNGNGDAGSVPPRDGDGKTPDPVRERLTHMRQYGALVVVRGKKAVDTGWPKASPQVKTVMDRLRADPSLSVALRLDRLVVLDIEGEQNEAEAAQLLAGGMIPATWTATTPSGGTHRYFVPPDGMTMKTTDLRRYGVMGEVRAGSGALVVLPLPGKNGRAWRPDVDIETIPPTVWPGLRPDLSESCPTVTKSDGPLDALGKTTWKKLAQDRQRQDATMALAGASAARGVDADVLIDHIARWEEATAAPDCPAEAGKRKDTVSRTYARHAAGNPVSLCLARPAA